MTHNLMPKLTANWKEEEDEQERYSISKKMKQMKKKIARKIALQYLYIKDIA